MEVQVLSLSPNDYDHILKSGRRGTLGKRIDGDEPCEGSNPSVVAKYGGVAQWVVR